MYIGFSAQNQEGAYYTKALKFHPKGCFQFVIFVFSDFGDTIHGKNRNIESTGIYSVFPIIHPPAFPFDPLLVNTKSIPFGNGIHSLENIDKQDMDGSTKKQMDKFG